MPLNFVNLLYSVNVAVGLFDWNGHS